MRVVVVGASSGLGRCLAVGLARAGEHVALLARRRDLLTSAAAEAGNDAIAVPCDTRDEGSITAAVAESAEALGGIDALVYASGVGGLSRIEQVPAAEWDRVFATNVTGASLVTAAALPHLRRSRGTFAYLSSNSASVTAPWPGLAPYIVSKAALDKLIEAWRTEHPDVGFTRVVVGECDGGSGAGASQLTSGWDPELTGQLFPVWSAMGLLSPSYMDVEDLVEAIVRVLRVGASASIASVAVLPRRPPLDL